MSKLTSKEIDVLKKLFYAPKISDNVLLNQTQIAAMKKAAEHYASKMSPEEKAAFKAAGLL